MKLHRFTTVRSENGNRENLIASTTAKKYILMVMRDSVVEW